MKTLALLPIAVALSLYGSAFFDVWTAPGLENLPTYDEVAAEHAPWHKAHEKPEALTGIIPVSPDHQFQPQGVAYAWGDLPVITLPALDPEEAREKATAAIKAADETAAANTRVAKAAYARTKALPPLPAPVPAFASSSRGDDSYYARGSGYRSGRGRARYTAGSATSGPRAYRSSSKRVNRVRSPQRRASGPRA